MRSVRALFLGLCLVSCGDVDAARLAINDPLDLIDDVEGPLRLFVLPSDGYACDATTGAVAPMVPDVAEGMVADAVVDVSLTVESSAARAELEIAPGEYVVLVRGKGTDPVSGIPNVFIATGCARATISAGETIELNVTLIPIVGMGECGDGTFSPDEQCEDGNTAAGDGCSASCRTEPGPFNTTTGSGIRRPSIAGRSGQRWAGSFDAMNTDTRVRVLEPDGATVTSPSVLQMDDTLRGLLPTALGGTHLLASTAVAPSGRVAISFSQFSPVNVRVAFFDRNLAGEADSLVVRGGITGASSAAFAGDGTSMVVLEDSMSASGISGQIYASGTRTPIAADPFVIGTGASAPDVAGAADHFAVAFVSGGISLQRFGIDGTARDAAPIQLATSGSTPSVAALDDGRFLVAWADSGTVRARAIAADGTPGAVVDVGSGAAPSAAGAGSAFFVAWESGGAIRARVLAADGTPIPNREQPPTTADFEVAPSGTEPEVASGGPAGQARVMVVWTQGSAIFRRMFPIP
jgi:cysteine-rich repeat protein